ncbi:leucine-rich repeat neuronal protein 4-like [Silurus meridionalis]|nr:leucine-rich repeat neuronal protein 4-like [Silurus meridionalis]
MLRKCSTPPLVLSVTLLFSFVSASSSVRNTTQRTGSPKPRLVGQGDDYNNFYDDPFTTKKPQKSAGSPPPLCDICKEQPESCQKLAQTLFCSCPGISGPFQRPDPPTVHSLSVESNGVVVFRWCAPASTVLYYQVYVGGKKTGHELAENRRIMKLGDVAPGTEVCVEAVNKVGSSVPGKHSCTVFEPSNSETRLITKLALIGAAVVLVLVIALVLLLWWCKRHRNARAQTANRGTAMVL